MLFLSKHGFDIVCFLDVLADLHVLISFWLKVDEVWLLKAGNHHWKVKISKRVEKQNLKLRVMFYVKIIKLRIDKVFFPYFQRCFSLNLSVNVLKHQRYRSRYQVLEDKWWCNRKVTHRYKLSLLGVEVYIRPNTVSIWVEHHKYLVVVSLNTRVFAQKLRHKHDRCLRKDFGLVLEKRNFSFLSPFKLFVSSVIESVGGTHCLS